MALPGGNRAKGGVRIMSCQVFDGDDQVKMVNEARAIKYAADNGAVSCNAAGDITPLTLISAGIYAGTASDEEWAEILSVGKEALDIYS